MYIAVRHFDEGGGWKGYAVLDGEHHGARVVDVFHFGHADQLGRYYDTRRAGREAVALAQRLNATGPRAERARREVGA